MALALISATARDQIGQRFVCVGQILASLKSIECRGGAMLFTSHKSDLDLDRFLCPFSFQFDDQILQLARLALQENKKQTTVLKRTAVGQGQGDALTLRADHDGRRIDLPK